MYWVFTCKLWSKRLVSNNYFSLHINPMMLLHYPVITVIIEKRILRYREVKQFAIFMEVFV